MSLETWKDEYYPVPAEYADPKTALELSELKWRGLRPEVLRKHELRKSLKRVTELPYNELKINSDHLLIDGNSCHLCQLYATAGQGCVACPITLYIKEKGTFSLSDESCEFEYITWVQKGDPEPMIELLQAVKEANE